MKRPDDLRAQLQSWGFHQVNRYSGYRAPEDDEPAEENPISRARAFAPMTRENVAKQLIGRDGRSRRRLMARQLYDERSGAQILDIVPVWACDPVPARNDAGPPVDRRPEDCAAVDRGTPDHLRWIDRALAALDRSHETPLKAMIVREEFCGTGTQAEKAAAVAARYGGTLSLRQYRNELSRALDWMRGRRAA